MVDDNPTILFEELPEVFDGQILPPEWDDDWLFVPVDKVDEKFPIDIENMLDRNKSPFDTWQDRQTLNRIDWDKLPDIPGDFPGIPIPSGWSSQYPPPDALAFYLPFHYFYPEWWGIYLTVEGTLELSLFIKYKSDQEVSYSDCILASQLFLYGHEVFHHKVESFATRMEVTHRVPTYKDGFSRFWMKTAGTPDAIEETLATAYGILKVRSVFKKHRRKNVILKSLFEYINGLPEEYKRGLDYCTKTEFLTLRKHFSEENQRECFPGLPQKKSYLWNLFSYGFTGIGRINSRINYLVNRSSPILQRNELQIRYLRYKEFANKLKKLTGAKKLREGKGSHEIWRTPEGAKFPVPRHPRDLNKGTLSKIIKQAGLDMGLTEFINMKV